MIREPGATSVSRPGWPVPRVIRWMVLLAAFFLGVMTLLRVALYLTLDRATLQLAQVAPAFQLGLRFDFRVIASAMLPLLVLSLGAACRRAAPTPSALPVAVLEVRPEPIVVREGQPTDVTIRGTGFDATANTVTVGPVILTAVRSTGGGTVIALSLPDRVPSGGGAAPMLWSPGQYALTVSNTRGSSVPVMVTIQEPR